jgi:hypothetical protein
LPRREKLTSSLNTRYNDSKKRHLKIIILEKERDFKWVAGRRKTSEGALVVNYLILIVSIQQKLI